MSSKNEDFVEAGRLLAAGYRCNKKLNNRGMITRVDRADWKNVVHDNTGRRLSTHGQTEANWSTMYRSNWSKDHKYIPFSVYDMMKFRSSLAANDYPPNVGYIAQPGDEQFLPKMVGMVDFFTLPSYRGGNDHFYNLYFRGERGAIPSHIMNMDAGKIEARIAATLAAKVDPKPGELWRYRSFSTAYKVLFITNEGQRPKSREPQVVFESTRPGSTRKYSRPLNKWHDGFSKVYVTAPASWESPYDPAYPGFPPRQQGKSIWAREKLGEYLAKSAETLAPGEKLQVERIQDSYNVTTTKS